MYHNLNIEFPYLFLIMVEPVTIGYFGNIDMFSVFCIAFSMDPLRSEIMLYYYYIIAGMFVK